MALALLAEAENETWANNATAEFVARFQVLLGGTSAPYIERLSVVDEIFRKNRPALMKPAIKALAQVGDREAQRSGSLITSDQLPEEEWRPSSRDEHLDCIRESGTRLCDLSNRGLPALLQDLIEAAKDLSMMLRHGQVRERVIGLFTSIRNAYPEAREPLRRIIHEVIRGERNYWKEIPEEDLIAIEELHGHFEDESLAARLQQQVGQVLWENEEQFDLLPIASELLTESERLPEHWPWLTSGEAADVWRLGMSLASLDPNSELATTLSSLPDRGPDLRLLLGYIYSKRVDLGDEWYDEWVKANISEKQEDLAVLFELAWRCGATDSIAKRLATAIREEQVDSIKIAQLAYGTWGEGLTIEVLGDLLWAMATTENSEVAIGILDRRIQVSPTQLNTWESLSLHLATTPKLIRSGGMASHHWKEVALRFVPDHAKDIATAIMREQVDRDADSWFIEHSEASGVLSACAKQDPLGTWDSMLQYLTSPAHSYLFTIGFPGGILDDVPRDGILEWISENTSERAVIVARIVTMDLSNDKTLAARLLGEYGEVDEVASEFFSAFISGVWSGSAGDHWIGLASRLESVAERTSLPKLRRWASRAASDLHEMAERDHQREQEEDLRRR